MGSDWPAGRAVSASAAVAFGFSDWRAVGKYAEGDVLWISMMADGSGIAVGGVGGDPPPYTLHTSARTIGSSIRSGLLGGVSITS